MRPSSSRRRIVRSERTTLPILAEWHSVRPLVGSDPRRSRPQAQAPRACVPAALPRPPTRRSRDFRLRRGCRRVCRSRAHGWRQQRARRAARAPPKQPKPAAPRPRAVPREMRGVHVTMALAGLPGKLNSYTRLRNAGLNTIELDVKDENGDIAFVRGAPRLARVTGAAKPYYDPRAAARKLHAAGLYLIGRVVTFQDPDVSEKRPGLALHNPDGSIWHTQ